MRGNRNPPRNGEGDRRAQPGGGGGADLGASLRAGPPPPSLRDGPPPRSGEELWLPTPAATEAFGAALAAHVRRGDVITLSGPLGAGKTSIARALLAALGLASEAPSPSFAIVQPYAPPEVRLSVLHVDLYRIEDVAGLDELGLDEARDEAVLLVEWPEHAPGWWPDALALTLTVTADGGRALTAVVPPAWEARWPT